MIVIDMLQFKTTLQFATFEHYYKIVDGFIYNYVIYDINTLVFLKSYITVAYWINNWNIKNNL